MTYQDIYSLLQKKLLSRYGSRESKNIARLYLEDKFGKGIDNTSILDPAEFVSFEKDMALLLNGSPMQYVVGKAYFYEHFFEVNNSVLIPRPETEELVVFALKRLREKRKWAGLSVLDIGTGSGCIALSLAKKLPDVKFRAIDISNTALEVAQRNAENLQVDIEFSQVDFLDSSSWSSFPVPDIIVSNPPYIDPGEDSLMPDHVKNFEPHFALYTDVGNPLVFYEKILEYAQLNMNSGSELIMEINEFRKAELELIFDKKDVQSFQFVRDLQEKFRLLHVIV